MQPDYINPADSRLDVVQVLGTQAASVREEVLEIHAAQEITQFKYSCRVKLASMCYVA